MRCVPSLLVLLLLAGCSAPRRVVTDSQPPRLTAEAYRVLSDREKVRHKRVVIRVPAQWGGVLLPFDSGPYASPTDKAVHTGELLTLMGLYNQSLFELEHPEAKIEFLNFDMWSDNFRSALAVALSGNRAPAYYIARDLPQTIEQGMYADITDLMKSWDQYDLQPEGSRRQGRVNGRIYTMAANELGANVIRYRKDWFREAGIINERGEPGPPLNWTWEDFRQIAKRLTDPKKGRFGFVGEPGDFYFRRAHVVDLYIPDPSGKHTWIFNEKDPDLLRSLQASRDMARGEKSVFSSVSMGWFEWHNEFSGGHAAMIQSFAPHIPNESLSSPFKFGKEKPYRDTVGMAPPPRGPYGFDPLLPETNPIGFDPTLSKEQLRLAFEWIKTYFYGDVFANRVRATSQDARVKGKTSTLYAELLVLPYRPKENLLDRPLEEVFPTDYLETYRRIRAAHAPPLPREFGLKEPPEAELNNAVKAMYSEAITTETNLRQLLRKTAELVNTNLLNFRGKNDAEALRRYFDARTEFYRTYFPRFHDQVWLRKLREVHGMDAATERSR